MDKKCDQIHIPEVENTSDCTSFINSGCVIMNRKSTLLKNIEGEDLNNYTQLLENYIKTLENRLKKVENIVKYININLPSIGIGIYEEQ